MKNVLLGGTIAGVSAGLLMLITAGGDYGWKIALALVGLVLWVLGGLSKQA